MAVGQAVLSPEVGLSRWAAVEAALEATERSRSAGYAGQLGLCLELLRLNRAEGLELSTPAELALLLRCSEHRATELLMQAELFAALPGGFGALEAGALTVEQARPVAQVLGTVRIGVQVQVWQQLLAQLAVDARSGIVRPPQRLRELLHRLLAAADPEAAVERTNDAAARDADVTYDRRPDSLVDLHAFGISGPQAHAALRNLAERAQPAGDWDDRPAGRRRLDALMDLLLGRQPLTADTTSDGDSSGGCAGGGGCGCPPGGGAGPCGVHLIVHVPLAAALGVSDVPAELVGHGPLTTDELAQLLLAAPALRAVFVDENGIPIAVGEQVLHPDRSDPQAVREALLHLASLRPGEYFPRHGEDHLHTPDEPPDLPPDPAGQPPVSAPPDLPPDDTSPAEPEPSPVDTAPAPAARPQHRRLPADPLAVLAAAALGRPLPDGSTGGRPHPAGQAGPYGIRPRLRQFLRLRAPRCEWPGCGARAVYCDLDHDLGWPDGPTCACNLGPLCRRHHRVKQNGWTKTRQGDGSLRWTSPRGRSWTSPAQHAALPAPVRPLPPITRDAGWLSPAATADERLRADPTDPRWAGLDTDPGWLSADPDHDPHADVDHLGRRIRTGATAWDLDLHNPYAWSGIPAPDPGPACS